LLLEGTLELQTADHVLKDALMRYLSGAGKLAAAREELRRLFEQVLERARGQGGLRADFVLPDLALLLWSFTPIFAATVETAPSTVRALEGGDDGLEVIAVGADRPEGGDGIPAKDWWTD